MAIQLIFPGGPSAREYAETFVRTATHKLGVKDLQPLLPAGDEFIGRFLDTNVIVETPPIRSVESEPNETMRHKLKGQARLMSRYWRDALPVLPGESVVSETFGVLTAPYRMCPEGAVYYQRKTDRGVLGILHENVSVDPRSGQILTETPAADSSVDTAGALDVMLVSLDDNTVTVVDAALTMATFLSFGIAPPLGLIAAGGFATIQAIFNKYCGSSQVSLETEIGSVVSSEIQYDRIVEAAGSFDAYSQWFSDYYKKSWEDQLDLPIPSDPETAINQDYKTFFKYLDEAANNPSAPMRQAISKLMTDHGDSGVTFQVKALQTFLYGASLHLNFLKVRMLLDALPKYKLDSLHLSSLVHTAKHYLDHANKVTEYIEKQVKDRLDQVSKVEAGVSHSCVEMNGRFVCTSRSGLLFTDSGNDKYTDGLPSNTVSFIADDPNSCCEKGASHPDRADAIRAGYLAQLTDQYNTAYHYSKRDEIKQTIAKLKEAHDIFAKCLPSSHGAAA